ncbi:MAG: hypothetical protein JSR37_05105 [Verrucomicrobia bacterium]|nr:hypothetical protein [Verrucomicrobiota bacterium]
MIIKNQYIILPFYFSYGTKMNPVSSATYDLTEQEIDERMEAVDELAYRLYGVTLETRTLPDLLGTPERRNIQQMEAGSDEESEESSQSSPNSPAIPHSPPVSISTLMEDDTTVAKPEERQDQALAVHTALKDVLINLGASEVMIPHRTPDQVTVITYKKPLSTTSIPAAYPCQMNLDQYHGFGYQTTHRSPI